MKMPFQLHMVDKFGPFIVMAITRFLLLAMILVSGALAEEKLKLDKLLDYEDVTIQTILPDAVTIFHSAGVATIPYEQLPEHLQQTFGFDAKEAESHRAKREADAQIRLQTAEEKKAERDLRDSIPSVVLTGRVLRILEHGAILENVRFWDGSTKRSEQERIITTRPRPLAADQTPKKTVVSESVYTPKITGLDQAFIFIDKPSLKVGIEYSGSVYICGTQEALTALGEKVMLYAFSPNLDNAVKYLGELYEENPTSEFFTEGYEEGNASESIEKRYEEDLTTPFLPEVYLEEP